MTERHRLTVSLDELTPRSELLDIAKDLQDLVSLAFDKPVPYEDLCFGHPDSSAEHNDRIRYHPIKLYASWHALPDPSAKVPWPHDMAFTFDDIGGAEGVAAWMRVAATYRGVLGRIMAAHHQTFVEDRLLSRVSAAEGFHRKKTAANRKLAERLADLVDMAGDPFKAALPQHQDWVIWVRNERDELTHLFERRPRREGSTHHFMAKSVYWLLVICLLREAQVPDAAFDRLANNQSFQFDMERASRILSDHLRAGP